MNDDFTFLIFTYHNVFHSLLASFKLRKWRLLALVSSGCPRMLTWRACSPSRPRSQPSAAGLLIKTNFQPKIGLKQPNALTQRSQPSIWVEKTTQRFLECSKTPRFSKIFNSNGFTFLFFTEGLGGVLFTPLAKVQVIGKHVVYSKSPRQGVASSVKTIGDAGNQYKHPTNTPSSPMTKHSLENKETAT